jgi:hypothetical protein
MNWFFHPAARAELFEAVEYYDSLEPGLGYRFLLAFEAAMEDVLAFPSAWSEISKGIRRCLIPHFSYGILYRSMNNVELQVLAVANLRRKPDHWQIRL